MKKFTIILFCFQCYIAWGQIGIGIENPHPSSALEIKSTSKGFLPPRLTDNQRDSIINPANGLIIFNTTSQSLEIYSQPKWLKLITVTEVEEKYLKLNTLIYTNNGF